MTRVLIVEDEHHLAEGLRFNLEAEGYDVETAADGEIALHLLLPHNDATHTFDAVVLDVMLPGKSGFEVAAQLRAANQFVPVLMLTARGRPEDVLRGFEAGADDYLTKPFELAILMARLRGLVRRRDWLQQTTSESSRIAVDTTNQASPLDYAASVANTNQHVNSALNINAEPRVFAFNNRTIDFDLLELRTPERTVRLTLMEAGLLRYLIQHAGRIVSRKQMLEDVWSLHEDTDTRAIDNFIVRLRRYIEDDPTRPRHLLTVRGVGYQFIVTPDEAK